MPDRVRMFISGAADLEAEREVIGRAVAQLPVSLGWVIKRTPKWGELLGPALEAIEACDFFVLLFSIDISAPVGVEWMTAQRAGKTTLAFLKDVPHTPAARVFIREAPVSWTHFQSKEELEILFQKALAQQILERAQAYALSPVEWETLSAFVQEGPVTEESRGEAEEVGGEVGGAGGGGVILSPERDLPSEGVLVEERG